MKLAVIGYPIRHSKSPFMHNIWLDELNIEGVYEAIEVSPDRLAQQIQTFKENHYKGFNVTIPHKEHVIQYLDEIDETAAILGAVNTVVINNGKCTGYNTDGDGFLQSLLLKRTAEEIRKSAILVIGAGGAAKGITGALRAFGADQISVANRSPEKAERLIKTLGLKSGLNLTEAQNRLYDYDIVINTTSVGMYPDTENLPLDSSSMKKGALAADIIYNPLSTQFLIKAESAGAEALNGIGMFVFQGSLAFQKWTSKEPDAAGMMAKMTDKMNQE
ncbi:shikimate dehydrogenase [Jeotgalibacillus malaysiensis]|uniref:Shikimate dehydrogenase (NADP(+)) n=1 Tax=Jeotgalibacillus malaysiensis TaxID=1508404 RepID=A0A0B5ASP7_9BACL|nr:shikimate dehydrogenase [Jeotgalibacillus malaysiensis]AJD91593.1 shikimate dehydrogenase [Jeotgalibacillus malaysiensis]